MGNLQKKWRDGKFQKGVGGRVRRKVELEEKRELAENKQSVSASGSRFRNEIQQWREKIQGVRAARHRAIIDLIPIFGPVRVKPP